MLSNNEKAKINELSNIFITKLANSKNSPIQGPIEIFWGKSVISLITWLLLIFFISIIILL